VVDDAVLRARFDTDHSGELSFTDNAVRKEVRVLSVTVDGLLDSQSVTLRLSTPPDQQQHQLAKLQRVQPGARPTTTFGFMEQQYLRYRNFDTMP
jgi:hypothetical protein